MNKNQEGLIYLLWIALHAEKVQQDKITEIELKELFELAKEQQVYPLIFPLIKDLPVESEEDKAVINEWKRVTILSSVMQKQNINRISTVLNRLKQAGMQVLALKGLVMRSYYQINEMRIMSDYDILMHIEDLDRCREILLGMGYTEDHRDSKHIVFKHTDYLTIEVHWLLTDPNHFKDGKYLEDNIWNDTKSINLFGADVLIPSIENQMLHLCLHLVVHFIFSGFGIRQIVDIFVLVEQKGMEMDWDSFNEKLKECNIQRFAKVIFEICRRLLSMKVPDILADNTLANDKNIDILIYSILFDGAHEGVFGKTLSFGPIDEKLLGHHEKLRKSNDTLGNLKYSMTIIFPKVKVLKENYNYAKKFPLLIPIAWFHRIVDGIFRKDFSFSQKKNLISSKSEILRSRAEIFDWLGIK